MDRLTSIFLFAAFLTQLSLPAAAIEDSRKWVKVKATNAKDRSRIASTGLSIETIASDYVIGIATAMETEELRKTGLVLEVRELHDLDTRDFPRADAKFHNYLELTTALKTLAAENPDLVKLDSIGKSLENRDLWHITLSTDVANSDSKPGLAFLGGHHAREHLSVEVPLKLLQRLVTDYRSGQDQVVKLLTSRQIHIIPSVNPDGSEYDIASNQYRFWRKNRGLVDNQAYGIDLNRNYGFGWGGGGASSQPSSDVYRGPAAFSEPETQAVKKFVEGRSNISILLSFHTFSELILYPWGHKDAAIENSRDFEVHKRMAETMAQWNGYRPMQSSELYIASGDTTDWSYGVHGIISFTFELDPRSMSGGGFYPGADAIDIVAEKNWRPCLYLMEYADNPYRVVEPLHVKYGLNSPLVQ